MTDVRKITGYLVVNAAGDLRALKRRPDLRFDEVAFPVTVTIPITWGRVQPVAVTLVMPEPPAAIVTVDEVPLQPPQPGEDGDDGTG